MKRVKSIIVIIVLMCLCMAGCSNSEPTNTNDYSDAVGNSPEAAISPSESYIIEALNQSEFILEIEAASESNDPNGKLNTDGGYNACVFFSSVLVNQSIFYEKSVVEKGTSCGGCIEVYSNEKDAIARNEYLAKFDGGILDSGSHTVIGTIVIRTSEKLTNEQQTELTKNLISIITSGDLTTETNDQENNETSNELKDTVSETTTPPTEVTTIPATEVTTESTHTHNFNSATCTAPKTCSCGVTEGEANGHNWKEATCSDPKICTVCGTTSGLTAGHNFSNGKCTICGKADPDYNYEIMVWIPTKGGTKYHTHAGCSNMEDPEQVTQSEAESRGFTPCKRCH